jgi:putative redox protein
MKISLELAADGSHTTAVDESGNAVNMYLPEIAGGNSLGLRPMQMLIMGVAGCTAVDVLLILKKQRQELSRFRMDVEAEREKEGEVALWKAVHLRYFFAGAVREEKAKQAVELSIQKYCSASETLRLAGADITWEVVIES